MGEVIREVKSSVPCVLVIDDDAAVHMLVERVLKMEGFHVLKADNGPDGLALLQHGGVDVLLVDKHLPNMNGYEIIQHARDIQHDLGVVLMTAFPERDGMAALKLDGYLPKPFRRLSDVADAVVTALDQRERRALQLKLMENVLALRHA